MDGSSARERTPPDASTRDRQQFDLKSGVATASSWTLIERLCGCAPAVVFGIESVQDEGQDR